MKKSEEILVALPVAVYKALAGKVEAYTVEAVHTVLAECGIDLKSEVYKQVRECITDEDINQLIADHLVQFGFRKVTK